jgi:hypothetical protein
MAGRIFLRVGVVFLVVMSVPAEAQHGRIQRVFWQGGHGSGSHHGSHGAHGSVFPGFATSGFYYAYSPILVIAPGGFLPPVPAMMPPMLSSPGPLLPQPPPGLALPQSHVKPERPGLKRGDPVRAGQLITIGDRMFRAGNLRKAEERYQQAVRTAPGLAAPQARLAQVALARGNYSDAANRLRDAETAEPGWIVTAPDIQAIYGEPAEFSRSLARLESYLQVHPDDRDAWLVLGAEWFLTGRTSKAADVFTRLNDPKRKADVALAAFLDASNQAVQNRPRPPEPAPVPLE